MGLGPATEPGPALRPPPSLRHPWGRRRQGAALPVPLRAPLRLLAIVATTPALYLCWVLTRPLAWVFPRSDSFLQRAFIGTWAKGTLWITGVRLRIEGPRPTGSFFLVANHLSYVDILVLLACLDARFLAKSEIAGWPVLGLLASSTGTLFIDRTRKRDLTRSMEEIRSVLARGTGVIVFPEGTSTDGAQVEPFKPSLFQVPVELNRPVHCAALHYACPRGPLPAWQAVCWWGDAAFAPHFFQFLKQARTDATVTFSAHTAAVPDAGGTGRRKHLALAAHERVSDVFTATRNPTGTRSPTGPPASTTTSS